MVARAMTTPTKTVYSVLYGPYKPYKKHPQWTHDGYVTIKGGAVTLENAESGKMFVEKLTIGFEMLLI